MIAAKHIQFVALLLGCLLALYVGSNIVLLPPAGLVIVGATIGVLLWLLLAGSNWWVPIFSGAAIMGVFHVGFKVYPLEAALALCLIGLLPLVLVQDRKIFQHSRKRLPAIFYITALFVIIRLLIDVIPATGARGNLARVLFTYTWYFGFAFLFHHYGSFSAARLALGFMFGLLLVRTGAALVGYFADIPLIVPGVNYVLSFSSKDSLIPMRTVAATVLMTTLLLFHSSKSLISKILLVPVFAFSSTLVIMGAGRFQTLVMLVIPMAFFAWSRKWVLLVSGTVLGVGSIAFINVVPESLNGLPPSAGRALSGLVFTENLSESDFATTASDQWHSALRTEGYRRLTLSPWNFLFGAGIAPSPDLYDDMAAKEDPEKELENAANVGAYENGLWNVLGVVGVVGFGLYLWLFVTFWRETLPHFFRRPKGTFWEGMVFWGCFSSITWYIICYFQGGVPGFELLLMIMAWDIVHEGKLDEVEEVPGVPAAVPYLPRNSLSSPVPVRARG